MLSRRVGVSAIAVCLTRTTNYRLHLEALPSLDSLNCATMALASRGLSEIAARGFLVTKSYRGLYRITSEVLTEKSTKSLNDVFIQRLSVCLVVMF